MRTFIRKAPTAFLLAVLSFVGYAYPANVVYEDDDETPEITDRVARITIIEGDAKIRRNGADEWEKVTANLPLVEGDEISTETRSRVEIQFDKDRHLRLDENSFIRLSTLKDTGIAISLSLGRASIMAVAFDKDSSFFEIDAPKTTLAIQRAGRYFVDAGERGDSEVRVSIDEGGEARIYSESAGFTLKDKRSARIFIDGANAGEWETTASFSDSGDFAAWVSEREDTVARRLNNAHYDRYYDQDIYGADDLSDNGDWVNTDDYGYVWRPSRLATAQYSNWSPYRYGHWRWMPPFGWVWVNDEPWGWATYHHGRWFRHNGNWVWSPYGYYRPRRSWWSPALVVINIYNNNVCWYPLAYNRRRHNINARYQKQGVRRVVPLMKPDRITPVRPPTGKGGLEMPIDGIVTADANEFGKRGMRVKTAPEPIARTILVKQSDDMPILPDYKGRRIASDLTVEKPRIDPVLQTRVGAGTRRTDGALDGELQKTRIYGGRSVQKQPDTDLPDPVRPAEPRKTGAVDRPVVIRQPSDPVKPEPRYNDPVRQPRDTEPVRQAPPPRKSEPIFTPPTRDERPTPKQTPRYDPPSRTPEKTREPAPVKQQPKNDSPPSRNETKPAPSRKERPDSR